MNVLIVDDHLELLDLVSRALQRDQHIVRCAGTLAGARAQLAAQQPDVLILDLALPDGSGLELCGELRRSGVRTPILMLTAHGEVGQRVEGLNAGADDFLAKPFAMAELRARVRALGRRGVAYHPPLLTFGDVELDLGAKRAFRGGVELPFTAREWSILQLLAERTGQVIGRNEILEAVWGEVSEAASASLDVIMTRVRRKLGANHLRTARGLGYALDLASAAQK